MAITQIVDWLSNTPGYADSYVYKTVMKYNSNDENRSKSYALRLLIHYMGDIH